MSFSFGFSGDDIEEDPNDAANNAETTLGVGRDAPPLIPARTHDLGELVGKSPNYRLFAQCELARECV